MEYVDCQLVQINLELYIAALSSVRIQSDMYQLTIQIFYTNFIFARAELYLFRPRLSKGSELIS